jgi:hypothetical protein
LLTVDVDGTPGVVARDDSIEGENTVVITVLDATQGSVVLVLRVVGVSVAAGADATVDASRVAVPGLKSNVGEGLAGGGVDQLDIKGQRHTRLVVGDILADELTGDPLFVVRRRTFGLRHVLGRG